MVDVSDEQLSGAARRLAEELEEDGIKLEEHDQVRDLLLDELDYARRIPMFEGRRGNPVVLSAALFDEVLALSGDAGARKVLEALGGRLALIEAPDDGVLFDVDRREDL